MGKTANQKKKQNKYDTTLKINGSPDEALNALLVTKNKKNSYTSGNISLDKWQKLLLPLVKNKL